MNDSDVLCQNSGGINSGLEFLNYEKHKNNLSRGSSSSGSSCHSDTSEETEISAKNETAEPNNGNNQKPRRKFRSMSAGNTNELSPEEPFEVFPSLPDSVLQKMELLGEVPRDRMSEDDIEQKFVSLALAFTIDAATIKNRCERQMRYRDQTETNLNVEIDKLIEKINCIQPLCKDAETTDILTGLLAQVEVVMRASSLAAISAERYGAVQHEERLAGSVNLMINHVTILKQQRDSARRQLQYTKRVLQDTNSSEPAHPRSTVNANGRMISKRRASIATITEPKDPLKPNPDNRRVLRRTSDLSLRASALSRSSRPSRLELSLDLVKIREGINESECLANSNENEIENQSNKQRKESQSSQIASQHLEIDISHLSIRKRIRYRVSQFVQNAEQFLTKWSDDGTLHEVFSFGALMCFSFSVIVMANLLIEIELTKRGTSST